MFGVYSQEFRVYLQKLQVSLVFFLRESLALDLECFAIICTSYGLIREIYAFICNVQNSHTFDI